MGGSIPMTREAYQRKRDEVEHMEKVQMPEIAEKIAAAREEGDLKENAEYHAQREAQGMLCLLYTSPSPRDRTRSRMPSSA